MGLGKIVSRLGDSKTYVLLLFLAILALITCVIAAAFGEHLWNKLFDLFLAQSGIGGGRAAVVDGGPKIAAAWRDPNSAAANPPSAMLASTPSLSGSTPVISTTPAETLPPFVPPGG